MGPAVTIVSHDARWPALFQQEKPLIIEALGSLALALEHVGSTSVPGLAAKPILDLMLGVRQINDATACIPKLQALGYAYEPDFEREIPEGRYFKKGPRGARTHHLHATEMGGSFWERHLLFRNWLRTHPEDARAYELLKRDLAARFGSDRVGYTDAKTDFIEAAVEKARAAATIPSP